MLAEAGVGTEGESDEVIWTAAKKSQTQSKRSDKEEDKDQNFWCCKLVKRETLTATNSTIAAIHASPISHGKLWITFHDFGLQLRSLALAP